MPTRKKIILNNEEVLQKINRIAYQIYEDNYTEDEIVLVGISRKGYLFAEKLTQKLKEIASFNVELVKITIKKDNPLGTEPKLDAPVTILTDKVVVLVDDVFIGVC